MAEEALKSLANLLESVPAWIYDLKSILQESTERQKEILSENQPAGLPAQLSRKPSKSSSLLSKPSSGSEWITPAEQAKKEDQKLRSQLPHMTQSDELRLAQRKRKTASALSDLSGPPRFRSRGAVVVYYDGETQKQFETLVRGIAANRNALRKGKVVAKVERVSKTGSGSSSEASSSGKRQNSSRPVKRAYVSTRVVQEKEDGFKDSTTQAFEQLDLLLDNAQALCEKAAHQVLRDGDCALEMRKVREHFVSLQRVGESELLNLQQRAKEVQERRKREHETQMARREEIAAARARSTPEQQNEKVENPFTSPGSVAVELEADSSDEEDVGFEVGALQLGKYGIRSTRTAAVGAV